MINCLLLIGMLAWTGYALWPHISRWAESVVRSQVTLLMEPHLLRLSERIGQLDEQFAGLARDSNRVAGKIARGFQRTDELDIQLSRLQERQEATAGSFKQLAAESIQRYQTTVESVLQAQNQMSKEWSAFQEKWSKPRRG